jgi:8-oxo-dGTP diphosphatase
MDGEPTAPRQVAAAIVWRDGRVLVTRRGPGEHLQGRWEFPGGKLEHGESPQACIVRELAEELGVDVTAGAVVAESLFEYPGGAINLIAVRTEMAPQPIRLTVHDAFEWVTPRELLEIDLAPADIPIARDLARLGPGSG